MQGLITIKSIGDNDMKKTVVRTKRLMILAVMMVITISARSAMPLGSSKNAMSVVRKNTRQNVAGSRNTKIPTSTAPMAPMPVHTG